MDFLQIMKSEFTIVFVYVLIEPLKCIKKYVYFTPLLKGLKKTLYYYLDLVRMLFHGFPAVRNLSFGL
jgi:hypothetical protein